MATQPDDLHGRDLPHVVARARATAAAAGELAPVPSIENALDPIEPEAKDALIALFRPGGAYWESSRDVAESDPDLA